ncbi:hypothetical protein Tco_0320829 [Tanacetum coccineum]
MLRVSRWGHPVGTFPVVGTSGVNQIVGLLDVHWSLKVDKISFMDFYLHTNDQISLCSFQAFHGDAIMGQMLYQFQGSQRDYFSNDTFRVRSLVSSAVYYEVTPPDTFPLRHIFEGVTDWYQSTGYRELGRCSLVVLLPVSEDEFETLVPYSLEHMHRHLIHHLEGYTEYHNPPSIALALSRAPPVVEFYSGDIVSRRVLTLCIPSPLLGLLLLWLLLLGPRAVPACTTLSNSPTPPSPRHATFTIIIRTPLPSSRHNHRHHGEPTATITPPPSSHHHHHPVTPPPSPLNPTTRPPLEGAFDLDLHH